jgi:hypothetical protein
MKTVFNSNTELASTFAMQNQFYGRSNAMFFERDQAFSYGKHYLAAKFIQANNGEKICFINSRPYSVTTAKHCQELWNAIPDGIKTFRLSFGPYLDLDNLQEYIKKEKKEIEAILLKQLSARTNWFLFFDANERIENVQEICKLFGFDVPKKESFENYLLAAAKSHAIKTNQ